MSEDEPTPAKRQKTELPPQLENDQYELLEEKLLKVFKEIFYL